MTPPAESILRAPRATFVQRAIALCWNSHGAAGGARCRRLVLEVELHSPSRAIVEAWCEEGESRCGVVERQQVEIELCEDDDLLHVDLDEDGLKAAISIQNPRDAHESRVVYAATSVLAAAGMKPGAYDPPVLRNG